MLFWAVFGLFLGCLLGCLLAGFRWKAFIQHFLLRFILWRNGYIPRNYVRFLDYAPSAFSCAKWAAATSSSTAC